MDRNHRTTAHGEHSSDWNGGRGWAGPKKPDTRLRLAKRQMVYQSGDLAFSIFEVIRGALIVFKLMADGRRQIVELVQSGSFSGFAIDGRYTTCCEALTDATVIVHSRGTMAAGNPVRKRLLSQLEKQCCALQDLSLTLGRKAARERLATCLLRFVGDSSEPKHAEAAAIRIPLTRAEVADYLGLSLETVSREIGALTDSGVIALGRRRGEIRVQNVRRLRTAARSGSQQA